MKKTGLIATVLAVTSITLGLAATSSSATPAPQWAGKGTAEANTACILWFFWAWGWPTETECLNSPTGPWGKDKWGRYILINIGSKTSQKLASAAQSVECTEAASGGGGIHNLSSSMQGVGVNEFKLTGCKVWKGKFASELKECHATSIEPGGEAGEAGKIKLLPISELVYLNSEGTTIGELLLPSENEGKRFALLDFTGTGCVDSGQQEVTGDALAEIKPQNEEVESESVLLPATALSKCWQWSLPGTLKECSTVGLKAFGSLALTASGEASVKLESKEKFDVLN